jgi:hypothetical protein
MTVRNSIVTTVSTPILIGSSNGRASCQQARGVGSIPTPINKFMKKLKQLLCVILGGHRVVYNDGPQRCIYCAWRPKKEILIKGWNC